LHLISDDVTVLNALLRVQLSRTRSLHDVSTVRHTKPTSAISAFGGFVIFMALLAQSAQVVMRLLLVSCLLFRLVCRLRNE